VSWNFLGHVIGPPECGKTYLSLGLVQRHLDSADNAFAFVHDPNLEFHKKLGLPYFDDAAAWRKTARRAAQTETEMPRGVSLAGDVAQVMALVRELGKRHNSVDRLGMKILLVIDEGVMVRTSGRSWISPDDAELIMRRRHFGVGTLWLAQDIGLDDTFYKIATDAYLFRLGNPKGLSRLELAFNMPPGSLTKTVPRIPEHGHLHIRNGKGFVDDAQPRRERDDQHPPPRETVSPLRRPDGVGVRGLPDRRAEEAPVADAAPPRVRVHGLP
jgi:hypothetical protein